MDLGAQLFAPFWVKNCGPGGATFCAFLGEQVWTWRCNFLCFFQGGTLPSLVKRLRLVVFRLCLIFVVSGVQLFALFFALSFK